MAIAAANSMRRYAKKQRGRLLNTFYEKNAFLALFYNKNLSPAFQRESYPCFDIA
jgi:hypothetical protein